MLGGDRYLVGPPLFRPSPQSLRSPWAICASVSQSFCDVHPLCACEMVVLLALYGVIYLAMYGWAIFVAVDVIEVVQFPIPR